MATFHLTPKSIGFLRVSFDELFQYSQMLPLVCDDCNKGLLPRDEIVVIPVLNQAYCEDCAEQVLGRVKDYPEDREIRLKREGFWMDFYGIKEVTHA